MDEAHRAKPSRYPILQHRWPFLYDIPMRRGELIQWMQDEGFGIPPKSSCVYCPFRSDKDWIEMKNTDPVAFEQAVLFEKEMRQRDPKQFLHDSCKPLDQVDFSPDRNLDLFGNECEGVCGV